VSDFLCCIDLWKWYIFIILYSIVERLNLYYIGAGYCYEVWTQLFTTGTTGGAGIAYPSGAHEFTTGWFLLCFCSVLWTIVVLSSISFYHCIVCPLIHDFWLCLRFFLRSFLNISPNYENMFEKKCLWETCVKIWFALAKRCFNTISAISIMTVIFTSGGHQSAWKKQLTAMTKLKHCFEK
jgi:hypothetical protein